MSSSVPPTNSFPNSPLINTITGYIAQFQEQKFFTREHLHSLKHYIAITTGFFVVLYFLIHIQIVFYWFLKLIFRLTFRIISIIFWLPLRTARFFTPKTIHYDILFPLFWLCSIVSFYISKISHENICQFYDQYLVRRYKILHYDQAKRDDIKRYLFILTFIVLLLLQSAFILVPIAASIRHHNENTKASSTPVIPKQTTPIESSTAKSVAQEAVDTMSENFYNRFIDAFKDESEPHKDGKRPPLISDEKLEHTIKTIQKSIKKQINNLKPTNEQNETKENNKSSRFQRWIVHYLKAPFQKWESKKNQDVNTNIEKKFLEDENKEENIELNSSSSIISDTDESDDDDDDDDDDDEDDENDDEEEENSTITGKIQQRIDTVKNLGQKLKENIKSKISSTKEEEEEEDEDDDDEEQQHSTITGKIQQSIDTVKDFGQKLKENVKSKISPTKEKEEEEDEDEKDDEDDSISLKERLTKPIEAAKNIGAEIAKKFSSSSVDDNDAESGYESDVEEEKQSSKLPEKVKKILAEPIEKVKNITAHIKDKIVSSTDNEDEQSTSITEQIKEHITKPIEDKLSSLIKHDENKDEHKSFIEDKKEKAGKIIESIKDKISTNADELKQASSNLLHSAEDFVSNAFEKSSEFLKGKTDETTKSKTILSKIKEQVVEPIENKVSQAKDVINTKAQDLKETIDDGIKSLKKKKKPKTLKDKAKDKLKSLSKSAHEKFSRQEKKKKQMSAMHKLKLKLKMKKKINGYLEDAWHIWQLAKTKLAHIFTSSTKHARHLPRYNTTSLYTAYTDLKCYDYTKQLNRYRLLKRQHPYFLDTYRHHSPFPVYLSILKSNGPKCYRHYPNSTCALVLKSSNRSFKTQLYRFARFWAIVGILVVILASIYAALTDPKQIHFSLFRHQDDSDRSSNNKQRTTISNKNDLSRSTTAIQPKTSSSSINRQTVSSNIKTSPLDQKIEKQLRLWLQNEKNDGFRNLSEACRIALNNTFLKKHEQLSVETLQFANAQIRDVSQTNNNNNSETPAEKIVINAVLDIDHLILNIVNTFREQHFSVGTSKLSGQLYILLVINPNHYSIEVNLQQVQMSPVNIIDSNNTLLTSEKQSIIKLLDEVISRTTVRCSFRLSDHQEDTNYNTLHNSAFENYPDSNKPYPSNNQASLSSVQKVGSRSRELASTRYQPQEPPPTLLVNDTNPYLYTKESELEKGPKKLLVRIVKAVKLHDVEQPYCILELNHPKQIKQTDIAKNGLNPFWDERFVFECDEQSNQLRLQIIDRKKTNQRTSNNYVDTVYADVSIPFSYATSTIYKQDIQINPQHPESIIRLEFSTLSKEEALNANNGYDAESIDDSQIWTYNDREINKIKQDYQQQYQQSSSNDFLSSSYDAATLPKNYGLSSNLYDDDVRGYGSTLPRSADIHSNTSPFSPSSQLTPRDRGLEHDKPQKSKTFMSSLKHLTLPGRKHRNKDKHDESMSSHASSISQLNTSVQTPKTNAVSHSLSSEYFLASVTDPTPIRRSRSISQSFRNLFRSSSRKKKNAAKADALGEYENGTHNYIIDNPKFLSTSTPTAKKLSFLHRRKSKQKNKEQTNYSTNSLSSVDCSRIESVRDTPVRANVGHPVTMTKAIVQ